MQKRRLSGAGRCDQRHRLTRRELERGAVQNFDRRVAAPVSTLHAVERSAATRAWSFIAQRLDRIELGRAPGRIDRRRERQDQRNRDDGENVRRFDARGQLRQEIELGRKTFPPVSQLKNLRIGSTL